MDDEHPDVVLLRRALEGDQRARALLVERVDPLIRARVRICLANGHPIGLHEIEDVTQQIWIRLLDRDNRRLHHFDPKRGTLEAYISMISKQEIAELVRSTRSVADLHIHFEEESTPSPENQVAARQQAHRLRTYLSERLSVKGQLVLRLLYDDGRSEDEAAEIMGVSKQVVANWKHKIKKHSLDFKKIDG